MPAHSNLRDIYRLQAECFENHVIHISYQSDRARNVRKVKIERRWDNTVRIGHGSWSEVWLQKSNGEDRAVKKLSKHKMEDLGIDYRRELDAMASLSRPRIREEEVIVAFLGWFESNDDVFIAMEYVPFGDLSQYITTGEIKEHDAKQIARDIIEALIIIQEEGFAHRDIKPENVFVMQKAPMWWVKLGDFGITKRIDNEQTALRTRIGTARYLAPEIEDDDFPDSDYTKAVDMWSLGCVIYTILARKPPFLTTASKKKPFPEAALKVCASADATDLVRTLLAKAPAERPTAKDPRSCPWFQEPEDPPGQNGLTGLSQNQSLILKDPAELSTAVDTNSNQRLSSESLKQIVIGGSSQSRPLLSTIEIVPPELWLSPLPLPSAMRPPIFGISLECFSKRDGLAVPLIVYQCIQAIDLYGLEVEGLYRINGQPALVFRPRTQFDTEQQEVDPRSPQAYFHDVNNVTNLLKQFLRDLPDPLLTKDSYHSFIKANKDSKKVLVLENTGDPLQPSKKPKDKKLKFVVVLQERLEKTVDDLKSWHRRFDPSWWLILRLKDHSIDKPLHLSSSDNARSLATLKSLRSEMTAQENNPNSTVFRFVDENALYDERELILGSQSTLAYLKVSQQYVVVDTIFCGAMMDPAVVVRNVQDLASILAKVDPSRFGLLSCYGAMKYHREGHLQSGYDLLFNAPTEVTAPRSLRNILLDTPSETPLNERLEIASGLARAVLFLHASCFVHKSIRPENVLVFGNGKAKLGKPYLVGFERFRLSTTMTHRLGDDLWEMNLYRHPLRQGVRPQEDFVMQHDVYSLGVVLLEIGLNTSFVTWPQGPEERPVPNPQLEIADLISKRAHFGKAAAIKQKFVFMAETILPNTFGQKYSDVVLSCLTCLDKNNNSFGDAKQFVEGDEDGVLVGVRYIDKVLSLLEDIAV